MKKKLFIQFLLFSIISILSLSFYAKFFDKKKEANLLTEVKENINQENLINDIKYYSKDNSNNTYTINAKSGKTFVDNPDLIELKDVNAIIQLNNKEEILISSNLALYNQNNYDTSFKTNVKIIYKNHTILCDKLNALFTKDLAVLNGNIQYTNLETKMLADEMQIDLISRTSKIYMLDKNKKIKVINSKKNGSD